MAVSSPAVFNICSVQKLLKVFTVPTQLGHTIVVQNVLVPHEDKITEVIIFIICYKTKQHTMAT